MRQPHDRSPRGSARSDERRHHDGAPYGSVPGPDGPGGPHDGPPPGWPDGGRGRRGHRHHPGPFGPMFEGREGRGRGRGGRARRGDMRLAVLRLLLERPMHGYEVKTELAERTGGRWDPSPGSIYPTLSALADEGLVTAENEGGRRTFTLTPEGRDLAAADTAPPPWEAAAAEPGREDGLRTSLHALRMAVEQVGEAGSAGDRERATALLDETRRALYLLLAGAGGPAGEGPA